LQCFFAKSLVVSEFCCTFAPSAKEMTACWCSSSWETEAVSIALFRLLLLARAIQFVFCDSTVAAFLLRVCAIWTGRWRICKVLLDGRHHFIEIWQITLPISDRLSYLWAQSAITDAGGNKYLLTIISRWLGIIKICKRTVEKLFCIIFFVTLHSKNVDLMLHNHCIFKYLIKWNMYFYY